VAGFADDQRLITIESGASLSLKGATLTYMLTQPTADIRIYVMPGGSLNIQDSTITGPDWDHDAAIKSAADQAAADISTQ